MTKDCWKVKEKGAENSRARLEYFLLIDCSKIDQV